jgi:hypothetical protein
LDLANPNLSKAEKASRIDNWASSEKGEQGELLNKTGVIPAGDPWIITEGSNVYHAGPFINRDRDIDGVSYDCNERSLGLLSLYRMAGYTVNHCRIERRACPLPRGSRLLAQRHMVGHGRAQL